MTVYLNNRGNDTFRGIDGEYNQVDYDASLSEFSVYRNNNGSVTISHPVLGTDTLINIDGLWSHADQSWYSIEDAIDLTPGPLTVAPTPTPTPTPTPAPTPSNDLEIDAFGILRGTDANDVLVHTNDSASVYGGRGNDTLVGTAGEYSQAEYDGAASEYTFTQNANGSVTVTHPVWGTDTLTNIDGFWFQGEEAWYAIEDLVSDSAPAPTPTPTPTPTPAPTPSNDFEIDAFGILRGTDANDVLVHTNDSASVYGGRGNDTLVGTAGEYSQAEYDGAASEYTFTQNANGSVTVTHPVWGTDTLTNIDGFWFQGEEAWYAIEDLVSDAAPAPTPTPTPTPQPDAPDTGRDVGGVITGSNDVNDFLNGTNGNDTFFAGRGTDVITGGAGNDTLRVDGDIIEWTFSANADGSVTMTHPTWGQNTLIGIEQIFSQRAGQSFSIDDAIEMTNGLPRFRLDNDNVINGTNGNDNLQGGGDIQGFYGGTGNDVYFGSDDFDQVNYDGARSEYTITENNNGSITVDHPIWGRDTLNDIDGLVFTGVEPGVGGERTAAFEFVSTDDLFG